MSDDITVADLVKAGLFDEAAAGKLQTLADETDDAADHDELHAAAEVLRLLTGNPYDEDYVARWIYQLLHRE